ncbi:hypothetical protein OKW30_002977 [Paraburkholderia sp. Clong3]|uniref:hypothetical protein n=1 Tax=unclassified Paraburkholderia TaxID=2615204 RepID=UPI0016182876|nr:hypothetical protein [Paraburkholderia sp. CI2]MBB5465510.1 hypothetical protein [Paraburkholderia sp. CI2]
MSLSVFEMHSLEMFCHRPLGACYVICDEWHYKACLRKAADAEKAKVDTREFLGIAELNCRDWGEDRKLVERIMKHRWLWFHNVRDRNPETDGWWVISALLDEVRRGSLLAIKGRRTDLFSQSHVTPIRTLAARAVDLTNGGPMLVGPYHPATRQTGLTTARAAMHVGSSDVGALLEAAVDMVGAPAAESDADSANGSGLANDGLTLTLLGDAEPFEYRQDAVSGDAAYLAGIGSRGDMYACDIISAECKGSVLREFPGQYLNSTLDDIRSDAQDGVKDARKALKLLNDGRFKK